jgi:four helix bundle protein
MAFEGLEKLRVYVAAEAIGDKMWNEVAQWESFERWTLGKQLVESADSISANIAESYGRYHPKDVVNFLYHARGSLFETVSWINKARKRKLITSPKAGELLADPNRLAPQLNAYINSKRSRIDNN